MGIRDTSYYGWQNIDTLNGTYQAILINSGTIYTAGYLRSGSYYWGTIKRSTTGKIGSFSTVDLFTGSGVASAVNIIHGMAVSPTDGAIYAARLRL